MREQGLSRDRTYHIGVTDGRDYGKHCAQHQSIDEAEDVEQRLDALTRYCAVVKKQVVEEVKQGDDAQGIPEAKAAAAAFIVLLVEDLCDKLVPPLKVVKDSILQPRHLEMVVLDEEKAYSRISRAGTSVQQGKVEELLVKKAKKREEATIGCNAASCNNKIEAEWGQRVGGF